MQFLYMASDYGVLYRHLKLWVV